MALAAALPAASRGLVVALWRRERPTGGQSFACEGPLYPEDPLLPECCPDRKSNASEAYWRYHRASIGHVAALTRRPNISDLDAQVSDAAERWYQVPEHQPPPWHGSLAEAPPPPRALVTAARAAKPTTENKQARHHDQRAGLLARLDLLACLVVVAAGATPQRVWRYAQAGLGALDAVAIECRGAPACDLAALDTIIALQASNPGDPVTPVTRVNQ